MHTNFSFFVNGGMTIFLKAAFFVFQKKMKMRFGTPCFFFRPKIDTKMLLFLKKVYKLFLANTTNFMLLRLIDFFICIQFLRFL